jgi:AraC-like DNA-binding protein
MRTTAPGVVCTLVPLGPVDADRPPAAAGTAVHEPCHAGAPQATPGRWRTPRHTARAPLGRTGLPGSAACHPPTHLLNWARSVVADLADANGPDDHPTAYLMIVYPQQHTRGPQSRGPVSPRHRRTVDRAIMIMEAAPADDLSVVDLARATNVSVRTLQAVFREHTGTTPMGYLRQLRLSRAHRDLLAADPRRDTVARIAHRWAFPHLGRFASAYRARYGYNPSITLHTETVPLSPVAPPAESEGVA